MLAVLLFASIPTRGKQSTLPEHDGLDAVLRPPREHAEEVDAEQSGHFGRSTQQIQLVHDRKARLKQRNNKKGERGEELPLFDGGRERN